MNVFELTKKFNTPDKAVIFLEKIRWNGKISCVYCESDRVCRHKEKHKIRLQCWNCHKSFSVTVGTIFHDSRLTLDKWFMLIALMLNAKKGLSACQASRDLGIRRVTVWSMMHRIRKAMATDEAELLKGIVEMDETYVGGKPRKKTKKDDNDDNKPKRGRGTKKTPVVGMVERDGEVRAQKASKFTLNSKNLMDLVRRHVNLKNTTLITDEYKGYLGMKYLVKHETINHSFEYARGNIHTNTIESFWAILKRGIIGQFHKVSEKYLHNYLDEFEYRYNRRKQKSNTVFENLLGRMCYGK